MECLKAFRSFWEGAFCCVRFFSFFHSSFLFLGEVTFQTAKRALHLISLAHLLGSGAWTHQRPLFLVLGGGRHESPLLQLFALFLGGSKVI